MFVLMHCMYTINRLPQCIYLNQRDLPNVCSLTNPTLTIASKFGAVWGKDYQANSKKLQNNDRRSEDILNSVGFPNLQTRREHN